MDPLDFIESGHGFVATVQHPLAAGNQIDEVLVVLSESVTRLFLLDFGANGGHDLGVLFRLHLHTSECSGDLVEENFGLRFLRLGIIFELGCFFFLFQFSLQHYQYSKSIN